VLPSEDQRKVRALTSEELDRIRASIAISGNTRRPPAFCRKSLAQLEIALQTGMRKSEQFRATWERIDWTRCVLFVPKSKNTYPRDVYLNSYVIAILRALQADQTRNGILPTDRIFDIDNPRAWFERTLAHAQITGITWHTLRHQFATTLISFKVSIKHVQDLMGHIDWKSTARYIYLNKREVFEAIALIADGSVPEYLVDRSYTKVLDDARPLGGSTPRQAQTRYQEPELMPQLGEPLNLSDLPPRMLSSIPREELYDLVWSKPVTNVATMFGRSDVAVAKTCRKRNIPLPERGRWNKILAGKPVPSRPPLPPL